MTPRQGLQEGSIPDYPNPFNPGFGVDPPYVAGREAIIHRLLANLNDGPGRATYFNIVVGSRGVGKTVLLNRVQRYVTDEYRWPVLRWTAGRDASIKDALDDDYDQIVAQLSIRGRGRMTTGNIGLSAGVISADIGVTGQHSRPTTVPGMLRRLGELAAARGRHVILLVDEIQAGNAVSLRTLSAGLQETNGSGLPVGLIAVGLPSTTRRLQDIDGITFLERQRPIALGNLDEAASRDAIAQPIEDADRTIDPVALDQLVDFCGGYPYAIQLAAFHAWEAAGTSPLIGVADAAQAITITRDFLDDLYEGRWERLSAALQHYLVAVVAELDNDGRASTGAVAHRLGRPVTQVAKQRDALIVEHQLIQAAGRGYVSIALPGMDQWVRNRQPSAPAD
jgi:AAA ATPase-like protein